jgi:hypothetical protein
VKVLVRDLAASSLQPGDVVKGFYTDVGWHDRSKGSWVVTSVDSSGQVFGHDPNGRARRLSGAWGFTVERDATVFASPVYTGTFPVADAAPRVKDWPLPCPKCGRADSAYLGLNDYDCKHGCYAQR